MLTTTATSEGKASLRTGSYLKGKKKRETETKKALERFANHGDASVVYAYL